MSVRSLRFFDQREAGVAQARARGEAEGQIRGRPIIENLRRKFSFLRLMHPSCFPRQTDAENAKSLAPLSSSCSSASSSSARYIHFEKRLRAACQTDERFPPSARMIQPVDDSIRPDKESLTDRADCVFSGDGMSDFRVLLQNIRSFA